MLHDRDFLVHGAVPESTYQSHHQVSPAQVQTTKTLVANDIVGTQSRGGVKSIFCPSSHY
jgi:hypothetical protein